MTRDRDVREQERDRPDAPDHDPDRAIEEPIEEPPHSTVDDWHGQKVADDMELADALMDETEGDVEEAEAQFEERTAAKDPERDINRPKPS